MVSLAYGRLTLGGWTGGELTSTAMADTFIVKMRLRVLGRKTHDRMPTNRDRDHARGGIT
jgi:hypothetical protein